MTVLKNGLKVVTVPMAERDSTAVGIWVRAGGRHEPKRISGVSHFLEHMLFKGTKKRTTRQIKEQIEGVGGMLNAFTGEESTCFFAKLLREHYGRALEVLSDMVKNAVIHPIELEKERTVILEEIKMYRDLPSHHVHDLMGELLWPDHALGRPLAGSEKTVGSMTRTDLRGYMKKMYSPSNFLITVAGPVGHDEVVERAGELFPEKKTGRNGKEKPLRYRQKRPHIHLERRESEQTHLVLGVHTFSRYDEDRYVLAVLNTILGGNMSSRLFEELREKRGLCYEVKSSLNYFEDDGSLLVSAGVESGKSAASVRLILKEFEKLRRFKVRPGELKRAKDYFTSQLYLSLEDTLDHMLWLGDRALYGDSVPGRHLIRQGIESVTAEDIQRLAKKIFFTNNLNLALIGPVTEVNEKKIRSSFVVE